MILFVCPTSYRTSALIGSPSCVLGVSSFSFSCHWNLQVVSSRRNAPLMQSGTRRPPPLHVGIAGAGIGGLSTALALLRIPGTNVGQVTVYEPRTGLDAGLGGALNLNGGAAVLVKGYGIDISPISRPMRGAVGRVADGSAEGGSTLFKLDMESIVTMSARGSRLLLHEGKLMARTVMRDRLQEILSMELKNQNAVVKRGARVSGVEQVDASDRLRFAFSDGALSEEHFDLCIGADGLRSAVRKYVAGNPCSPRYSGLRVRFAISEPRVRKEESDGLARAWYGNGLYCLQYTAGSPDGAEQDLLAVCFRGLSPTDENPAYDEADIRIDCKKRLDSGGMPATVMEVFDRSNRFVEVGVYYHEPLSSWHDQTGRCTLVGDAAHAMPPFLGQGANQAIQDSYALAQALSRVGTDYEDLPSALSAYEKCRIPPTRDIMLKSRIIGNLETQDGIGAFVRNNLFRVLSASGIMEAQYLSSALPIVLDQ